MSTKELPGPSSAPFPTPSRQPCREWHSPGLAVGLLHKPNEFPEEGMGTDCVAAARMLQPNSTGIFRNLFRVERSRVNLPIPKAAPKTSRALGSFGWKTAVQLCEKKKNRVSATIFIPMQKPLLTFFQTIPKHFHSSTSILKVFNNSSWPF